MRRAGIKRDRRMCLPGWSQILRKIGFQPLLRDGVQRTVGLCGGDDGVDLLQQRRLLLVQADIAGRIFDQELKLGALRWVLRENSGGHDIARGDGFHLTGEEGRDSAVIVLVALDGRISGSDLGQFRSSTAPRVTPMVLPAKSSALVTASESGANTPLKKGA